MKKAIQFGAGNIGRGFIGGLLSKAGYHVVFADVNQEIIDKINEDKKYTIFVKDVESSEIVITDISGVNSTKPELIDEVKEAEIITTAVGVRILPIIQNLHKFEDEAFFKKHKEVYVYTPKKTYTYTIFAAYKFDDRHLLKTFNFKNKKKFENYLRNVKNIRDMGSHVRKDQEVTSNDKIITLSTCVGGQPNNRYLVQAVLTDERSTK